MRGRRVNWARNVSFCAERLHRPASVEELQRLVAASPRIRALGTGHSFNAIADSSGDQVSVAGLPPVVELDPERRTVTVAAGVRYGELANQLHAQGFALHNLGSLPHISVAGACATGTHGSGIRLGSLATAVRALETVTADGDLVTLTRADHDFPGAVVALGLLGVVTSLTLEIEPTFAVQQHVYENLPREQLDDHLDEVLDGGYSVSLFTTWQRPSIDQVWCKRRVGPTSRTPEPRWFGATLAATPRHPVPGMSPDSCTEQLGAPGPWHRRLPHFRLDFTPSSGDELQSEYLVPRSAAAQAFAALDAVAHLVRPVLQVAEIRTVAADDLWLSPAYHQDCVAVHFTWVPDAELVRPVLDAVEQQLAPFGARPHWGKVFGTSPDVVATLYERLPDVRRLVRRYDPEGTFGNAFTDRYLAG